MIALLADEDFNGRAIRGLLRRVPQLDIFAVSGSVLAGLPDERIAAWAAARGRIIMTHDVNTMPQAAYDRARQGWRMPGVIVVPQQLRIGAAITDLELIVTCAHPGELEGRVIYLPL